MAELMAGKRGLIMGLANDKSLAWGIAKALSAHGAELAFSYQGEAMAKRVRPLAASLGADLLIDCDVSEEAALDTAFATLAERWPTIDFLVHAIGFSDKNQLRGKFVDTSLDNFQLTMNISAFSFVAAARRARAMMPEGGALLTLSYYGAEKVVPHYNVMGLAKAALETSVRVSGDGPRPREDPRQRDLGRPDTDAGGARYRRLQLHPQVEPAQFAAPPQRDDRGRRRRWPLPAQRSGEWRDRRDPSCRRRLQRDRHEGRGRAGYRAGLRVSFNTFGRVFRFTTWGESHGPALGAVVDNCPPGLTLSEADIQPWLDKRRPGTSRFTTQRQEPDQVRILSGTYEGRTTGTPISLMIENVDQRSKDYSEVAQAYRPGHADYAYDAKYGLRDPRGGGRSSARETAARVAAGAVARLVIPEVAVRAYLVELGGDAIDRAACEDAEIDRNPFFCPDPVAATRWEAIVDRARKAGSSVGAVVECVATGVPAGWGAPVYAKLDSELAAACMSINAVKGVEIGDGFDAARLTGEENADPMRPGSGSGPTFLANHAGGVAGGIATGQPVVVRIALKPTSSILTPVETIGPDGAAREVHTKGRHDPCVGIRAAPVLEAMVALVLADQKLLHRAQCVGEV